MTAPDLDATHLDDANRYSPAPAVLAAERQTVGAALTTRAAAEAAAEVVGAADFFDPELALVFQAVQELVGAGKPADPVAVLHALTHSGQLGMLRRTGSALLLDLQRGALTGHPDGARHHAGIVAADAYRRALHTAFLRGVQATGSPEFDRDSVDRLVAGVTAAAAADQADGDAGWLADDIDDTIEDLANGSDADKVPTPWADINAAAALRPGQLVIVGADTGGGKSLWGMNVAACASIQHPEGALYASLEMPRRQLHRRLIASIAGVPYHHLEQRRLSRDEWDAVSRARARFADSHLLIDAGADLSVARLRARLRYMRRTVPTRLIIVDYLQLMRPARRGERRDLELAELTRSLKLLALGEDVCVVALSQLNRSPGQRVDKRPQLHDLRESGALEQDADTVILLHQPEDEARRGELDMIVAKQRSGPTFTVTTLWQGQYARISDMAKREDWSPSSVLDGRR